MGLLLFCIASILGLVAIILYLNLGKEVKKMEESKPTVESMIVEEVKEALDFAKQAKSSRENSIVITKLEEALMWCNKDRTIKGELSPNPTHVMVEETAPQESVTATVSGEEKPAETPATTPAETPTA